MKRVQYKVTGTFWNYPLGTILDAYLVMSDSLHGGVYALIWIPKHSKRSCASLEICYHDVDGCYISASKNWIAVNSQRSLAQLSKNSKSLNYSNRKKRKTKK